MALITLARAVELVPNFPAADNAVMADCINAASDVIERYCNRTFAVTNYDELYQGTGDSNLLLNNYPVTKISRVAYNLANVVQLQMTDQAVQRASWRIDGTTDTPPEPNYLYLESLKNGATTTITIGPLTSATPTVTINAGDPTTISPLLTFANLASAINTYGGGYGWSAMALGVYSTWAVADLRPPLGGFDARGGSALTLHSSHLPYFEFRPEYGEVVAPMGFEFGYNNWRIVYSAGYPTIPTPIQQACAALAVSVYNARTVNANLGQENLGGYQYQNIADKNFHSLDLVSRYALPLYKNHRQAHFKVNV